MVAAGFHFVVAVLIAGSARLAPGWWTAVCAIGWLVIAAVVARRWRRTGLVLGLTLGGFIIWTAGAAILLG